LKQCLEECLKKFGHEKVEVDLVPDKEDEMTEISWLTGERQAHFPECKRACRVILSFLVLLIPYCLVSITLAANISTRDKIEEVSNDFIKYSLKGAIAMLTQVAIAILDLLFSKINGPLAHWENHRELSSRRGMILGRSFAFHCINSYTTIVYVAFFETSDTKLLDVNFQVLGQMLAIPLMSATKKFFERSILRHLLEVEAGKNRCYSSCCDSTNMKEGMAATDSVSNHSGSNTEGSTTSTAADGGLKEMDTNYDGTVIQDEYLAAGCTKKEFEQCDSNDDGVLDKGELRKLNLQQQIMSPPPPDPDEDFIKIAVHFGLVILFSSAVPAAALVAFITNLLSETRTQADHYILRQRCPIQHTHGLGHWKHMLAFIMFASFVTNGLLLVVDEGGASDYVQEHDASLEFVLIWVLTLVAASHGIDAVVEKKATWVQKADALLRWKQRPNAEGGDQLHTKSSNIDDQHQGSQVSLATPTESKTFNQPERRQSSNDLQH
jgi:hypothetical protein